MGAAQLRYGNGPGNESAHAVDDLARPLRPVDGRKLLREHGRVGGPGVVLRNTNRGAGCDRTHGVAGQLRRDDGQPLHELARGLRRVDRRAADLQDVALVHAGREIHGGHARLVQVVEDGALHGRRAAQLRQNARVHVDAAEARNVQHPLRKNLSVGHDDDEIGRERLQFFIGCVVPEGVGLEDRNVLRKRILLDGRLCELHAAVLRRIGLCIDRCYGQAGGLQPFEAHAGNLRRAHEYQLHAFSSGVFSSSGSSSSSSRRSCSSSSGVSMRSAISV